MPVQLLNKTIRDEIFRRTVEAVRADIGPSAMVRCCLEFAWHGYRIIKNEFCAPRTIIQAGSAQWPRVPPELDDGISPTHFAYEWDPDSEITRLILSGISPIILLGDGSVAASIPEMHVWLSCPASGEIIDFTTGLWPAACLATLGQEWLAPPPPEYFWNFGSRLPVGVKYLAARDAIDIVLAILHQQDREYP